MHLASSPLGLSIRLPPWLPALRVRGQPSREFLVPSHRKPRLSFEATGYSDKEGMSVFRERCEAPVRRFNWPGKKALTVDSVGNGKSSESGVGTGKLEQSRNLSRFVPESLRSLPGWICSASIPYSLDFCVSFRNFTEWKA